MREAQPVVLGKKLVGAPGRRPRWHGRAENAVAVSEAKPARGVVLDPVPALVHEAVVVEAEQHEVPEARLPAVRPVHPVVRLEVAAALAAREAADVAVACLEQAAKRRRHGASPTAGAHREPVSLDLCDELRVAAQPPRRLGRDDRAVLELGAAAAVGRQRGGVDVDDEPRTIESLLIGCGERGPGEVEKRLYPRRARRLEGVRRGRGARLLVARSGGSLLTSPLDDALPRGFQRLDEHRAILGGETGPQVQRAVLLEVVVHEFELVCLPDVRRSDPPVGAKRALELGGRERLRELQQALLGGRGRDPRQRAHLREGELAASERLPCRGQLLQGFRDADVLARLASRDPAAIGEESRRGRRFRPLRGTPTRARAKRAVAAFRCAASVASSSSRRIRSRHRSSARSFVVSTIVVCIAN